MEDAMKEKEEAIVLLNDGEQSNQEGHCNSWPKITYDFIRIPIDCQ